MNDDLSVWKEIGDGNPGNWIIVKCWQTGDAFSDVYARRFKLVLDKTYNLMNKLNTFDLVHHTDVEKNILHFIFGIYIWNKYSKQYQDTV